LHDMIVNLPNSQHSKRNGKRAKERVSDRDRDRDAIDRPFFF
jgi:hypothetical protein